MLFAASYIVCVAISAIKERYLSGEASFMVAVLSVSLISHYIWLRSFVRRGIREFGGRIQRLPDFSELFNLGLNLSITFSASIYLCLRLRGISGSWSRFLSDGVAQWYLVYCGLVLLNHVFDRLMEWGGPRRRRPLGIMRIDATTMAVAAEFRHMLDFAGNLRYDVRIDEV